MCLCVCVCVRAAGWLLSAPCQRCVPAARRAHSASSSTLKYVPRRAVLYCPGNDDRKLRKLASLDLDCAVLDCEDGVALSKKVGRTHTLTHTRIHSVYC